MNHPSYFRVISSFFETFAIFFFKFEKNYFIIRRHGYYWSLLKKISTPTFKNADVFILLDFTTIVFP